MKQLDRLLFLQGNRCFFCHQLIPAGEASVEHLVATSNGGYKDDENCVACCKSINEAFGNLSIKSKIQIVMNHRGVFECPRKAPPAPTVIPVPKPQSPSDERLAAVVEDLNKRGPTRPRKISTLKNAMKSITKLKLSDEDIESLVAEMVSKGYITVQDTKVTYALPATRA